MRKYIFGLYIIADIFVKKKRKIYVLLMHDLFNLIHTHPFVFTRGNISDIFRKSLKFLMFSGWG